ncbi:FkbM family methyltransferase [Alsobacter sp. R-9]
MKAILKKLLAFTPYRVVRRTHLNRFNAQSETLQSMKDRGYRPPTIIDGGANVGEFTRLARRHFPNARFELIEPQPGCRPALAALAATDRVRIHAVALGAGSGLVSMRTDDAGTSTGAQVVRPDDARTDGTTVQVQMQTLDTLFRGGADIEPGSFLKLDLQGHEIEALKGARAVLSRIEVILSEVSFYSVGDEPHVGELVGWLADHGFELHDIVALAARQRDNRLHQGDILFVRRDSHLAADRRWT